jgi:hypothetical protein
LSQAFGCFEKSRALSIQFFDFIFTQVIEFAASGTPMASVVPTLTLMHSVMIIAPPSPVGRCIETRKQDRECRYQHNLYVFVIFVHVPAPLIQFKVVSKIW